MQPNAPTQTPFSLVLGGVALGIAGSLVNSLLDDFAHAPTSGLTGIRLGYLVLVVVLGALAIFRPEDKRFRVVLGIVLLVGTIGALAAAVVHGPS